MNKRQRLSSGRPPGRFGDERLILTPASLLYIERKWQRFAPKYGALVAAERGC